MLCTAFTLAPETKKESSKLLAVIVSPVNTGTEPDACSIFTSIQLDQYGLSEQAFIHAWKGYQHLLKESKITRQQYLTVCDLSQSSSKKRFYIIDIKNPSLVMQTYVAHGKNSGAEYATRFSNKPESLQTSLGFYITSNTYIGKHGLSLRLEGVDPGFNDKALVRTIVMHGASYVDGARAKAGIFMGRSWGCPAVPANQSTKIINTIKEGSCLFIYHPDNNYLTHSKILNG